MKRAATYLLFLLPFLFSKGNDSAEIRKFELVLNITNAISRFSGNGVKNVNEDPYLFAVKFLNKKNSRAFRLGFNQSYSAGTTPLFPGERRTRDYYFAPIAGHEWRRHIDKHFMFYFGLDARMGWRNGSVETRDAGGSPVQLINSSETSYGAGPFCGFVWKINPRVNLFTEANFYALYNNTYRYMDDGFTKTILEDSKKIAITPVVPTSIFLSVNF